LGKGLVFWSGHSRVLEWEDNRNGPGSGDGLRSAGTEQCGREGTTQGLLPPSLPLQQQIWGNTTPRLFVKLGGEKKTERSTVGNRG
jgi:hypothetical protein